MAESVALEMGIPKARGLVAGLFSHTPMDANRFLSISGFEERIKNEFKKKHICFHPSQSYRNQSTYPLAGQGCEFVLYINFRKRFQSGNTKPAVADDPKMLKYSEGRRYLPDWGRYL